jgi:hypothetical protein
MVSIRVDHMLFLAVEVFTHLVTQPSLAKEAVIVCLAATVGTATSRARPIILVVASQLSLPAFRAWP